MGVSPKKPGHRSGSTDVEAARRQILAEEVENSFRIASDLFKWTLASLVLVNGGALVSLASVEQIRPYLFGSSGWLFAGGLVAALLGGGIFAVAFAAAGVQSQGRRWDPTPLSEDFDEAVTAGMTLGITSTIAMLLWVASAGLFIAGCFATTQIPMITDAKNTHAQAK